jgi:16S rRNA (cytidine1402-2'-O)-methyltransferase
MLSCVADEAIRSVPPGLYVVATPIGNLSDLSPRAAAVIAATAVAACEDTRTSAVILKRAGFAGRSVSLTEHNVGERIGPLLAAAAEAPVVLMSDAGTPGIADPGARLVAAAHTAGVPIRAVAGPSALSAALSVAGFDFGSFVFLGFLPRTAGPRRAALARARGAADVAVFFESPRRLGAALRDAASVLGDPETVVCRELTKLHEEVVRGPASSLAARFEEARGECVVVVRVPARADNGAAGAEEYLAEMKRAGARRSGAAAEAARRFGIPRQQAYALWESV